MSQPDPPTPTSIDQSRQRGGVSLGAFNRIEQVSIGDVFEGDKVVIQTFQLIIYTGSPHPGDPAMRADLLRAYRSEVTLRYAVWRRRYATLPMVVLPIAARVPGAPHYEREDLFFVAVRRDFATAPSHGPQRPEAPAPHTFTDLREGLDRYEHLILLGPPGGGKTTALWRLALDLAEAGRLAGAEETSLPVFVRLGGLQPGQSLRDLLRADLASAAFEDADGRRFPLQAHRALAGLLDELLAEGRLTLLWDGLNETPRSRFAEIARALDAFRREYPGQLGASRNTSVTTCRSDDHAQLVEECGGDPYPVQGVNIQGLDNQTIRQVVIGRLGPERGAALLEDLARPEHATLAALARTPLLLTMLCESYDAAGELPRNRGQLLQRFVARRWAWEQERRTDTPIAVEAQELALSRLAYAITKSAGRGTAVPRQWAEQQFRAAGVVGDPAEALRLSQAADLVETLADGAQIRFTHQLVQEYFAALALRARLRQAETWQDLPVLGWLAKRHLRRFARPGVRTGWEETLLLLAGIEGETGAARRLIRSFVGQPLQAARLLEAEGASADPALRDEVRTEALRQIGAESLAWRQRLDAGRALGILGDPRFPVRIDEWRAELARRSETFGQPAGYWCYLPAGTYRIGGWKGDQASAEIALPAFWIARYPITVAQFAPFVHAGYGPGAERWWTPEGWRWKRSWKRAEPWRWGESGYNAPNQAVIGVTWYEAAAFCAWLTEQLGDALPAGYEVRLPTEAEWEAAAAWDGRGGRRPYPWGAAEPTPELAIYNASGLGQPAPVGMCPAGAAACGALDLAGNVWEWTASSYKGYPARSGTPVKDFTPDKWDVPVRGGSWWDDSTSVRCGARFRDLPVGVNVIINWGLRVCAAPRSHKGSEF